MDDDHPDTCREVTNGDALMRCIQISYIILAPVHQSEEARSFQARVPDPSSCIVSTSKFTTEADILYREL